MANFQQLHYHSPQVMLRQEVGRQIPSFIRKVTEYPEVTDLTPTGKATSPNRPKNSYFDKPDQIW